MPRAGWWASSRRDLLRTHTRPDSEIRIDVVDNVLRRSLRIDPLMVQVDVVNGVVTLNGRVESSGVARMVVHLTADVAGVVNVVDRLDWQIDDPLLFHSRRRASASVRPDQS
jgi:BON domain